MSFQEDGMLRFIGGEDGDSVPDGTYEASMKRFLLCVHGYGR